VYELGCLRHFVLKGIMSAKYEIRSRGFVITRPRPRQRKRKIELNGIT
jgi:hypothetical protein